MDLTLLDVAIGMVLIYSLLSLICSTINEGLASYLSLRATTLKAGLDNLLGANLATQVYDHHLVQGLVQQDVLFKWRRKPSYIPTRTFVLTVLDTLNDGFPTSTDEIRLAIQQKVPDPKIQRALLALVDEAKGDFDEVKKNFGVWFDHSMDRVSGWYRRKVQLFILLIGIVVSFGLGVDSTATAKLLWGDSALREALVEAAKAQVQKSEAATPAPAPGTRDLKQVGKDLQEMQTQFAALDIPTYPFHAVCTEWQAANPTKVCPGFLSRAGFWLRRHLLGFIITAAALSLGAPFWFDLLNKLVSLRSAGQKPVPEAATIQANT
jgi:hypothetical protein